MILKKVAAEIASREGKELRSDVDEIAEILGILCDLVYEANHNVIEHRRDFETSMTQLGFEREVAGQASVAVGPKAKPKKRKRKKDRSGFVDL